MADRREFEMTQEDLDGLLAASKPVPYLDTGYASSQTTPTEWGHETRVSITTEGRYWLWSRA